MLASFLDGVVMKHYFQIFLWDELSDIPLGNG